MADPIIQTFNYTLDPVIQISGLLYLLGSLTVSSLSDLRRLAAQKDFSEVWGAFTILLLTLDMYLLLIGSIPGIALLLKWALILSFTVLTTTGKIFRISTMDVTAITALLALLNPAEILLAGLILLLANELLHPFLKKFGEAGAYPFLPVVFTVNLLLITYHLLGGPNAINQITLT
ncbi:hypothetical protein ACFLRF_06630 [Candidatus Altiarchaeota archaeon]